MSIGPIGYSFIFLLGERPMSSVARSVMLVVCVWGLSSFSRAAEPLDSAVEKAAEMAQKKGHKSVLVVVREDVKSDADPQSRDTLNAIRDSLKNSLGAQNLQVVVPDPLMQHALGDGKSTGALKPDDVAQVQPLAKFDVVLSVDVNTKGSKRTLNVSLVDGKTQHFTRSVSTPTGTATTAKNKKTNTSTTQTTGTNTPTTGSRGSALPGANNYGNNALLGGSLAAGANLAGNAAASGAASAGGSATATGTASKGEGTSGGSAGASTSGGGTTAGGATTNTTGATRSYTEGGGTTSKTSTTSSTKPSTSTSNSSTAGATLNEKVAGFAASQIGKVVGDGSSTALVVEALKAANARPAEGTNFGDPISLESIRQGDILVFSGARFENNGNPVSLDQAAIVYGVQGDRVYLLQQGYGTKPGVSTIGVALGTKTSGDVTAYRPASESSPTPTSVVVSLDFSTGTHVDLTATGDPLTGSGQMTNGEVVYPMNVTSGSRNGMYITLNGTMTGRTATIPFTLVMNQVTGFAAWTVGEGSAKIGKGTITTTP